MTRSPADKITGSSRQFSNPEMPTIEGAADISGGCCSAPGLLSHALSLILTMLEPEAALKPASSRDDSWSSSQFINSDGSNSKPSILLRLYYSDKFLVFPAGTSCQSGEWFILTCVLACQAWFLILSLTGLMDNDFVVDRLKYCYVGDGDENINLFNPCLFRSIESQ